MAYVPEGCFAQFLDQLGGIVPGKVDFTCSVVDEIERILVVGGVGKQGRRFRRGAGVPRNCPPPAW